MEKFKVTGIIIDKYDNTRTFTEYTTAISSKKAVSNISFRARKQKAIIRDVLCEAV